MAASSMLRVIVLLVVTALGVAGPAQAGYEGAAARDLATADYDTMIRQQMEHLATMKNQMAATMEALIERNMADPAIRRLHAQHVVAATSASEAPLDLREFTKRYLATSGFQVPYRPPAPNPAFIENEERRAWESWRQREGAQGMPAR